MASEAYKRMMKRIPKEIQQQVEFNLDIADEIYNTLVQKGLKAADLARLMGKSESEVSKWMTGTHNFSMKTIQKIGLALGTELIMTKSAKIEEYEDKIKDLEDKCDDLELKTEGLGSFYKQFDYTSDSIAAEPYFNFLVGKKDPVKLKANVNSEVNLTAIIN